MKIIYFTKSKEYTCKGLEYMINNFEVLLVVCKSYDVIKDTELEMICRKNHIQIVDTKTLYELIGEQKIEHVDLAISNNYGHRIKSEFLGYCNNNCINIHSAILPDYKGLYAYNHGIYNGETEWGVTAHYVNENFDEGEIIKISRFSIDSENITVSELENNAQKVAYELTISILEEWKEKGRLSSTKQKEGGHYYSLSDFENLKKIDLNCTTDEIKRKIRATWCPPYEGPYIDIDGKKYHLVP